MNDLSVYNGTIVSNEDTIWNEFTVSYNFPVVFTRGLFAPENHSLANSLCLREPLKRHRCLVFIDDGLVSSRPSILDEVDAYARAHRQALDLVMRPQRVAGGEGIKTDVTHLEAIQTRIHDARIDRHSFVIAIGGGAVLDAVGLACATAHRGVRHIRVPTTVLAQNDSGVGVKNAVNLNRIKNYTGTFAPPWAVLNDYDFVNALPTRDRIAGIAEAVKVALIRDGAFFDWLERNVDALARFDPAAEQYMIRRCAELHIHQISHGGDPFENGSARPLDFGHWAAHKLESMTNHALRHGEAVAIGLALDTRYSVLKGLLPAGGDDRVAAMLERLGFEIFHPSLTRADASGGFEILSGLTEFREHLGGELTITLLSDLGIGVEVHEIDDDAMADAMAWLQARSATPA